MTWTEAFDLELILARGARSAGNEGKARVCARRAVGILLGEYFRRNHIPLNTPSAYERLRYVEQTADLPEETLVLMRHFLIRINPDYSLPVQADLIAEAQQLRRLLLQGAG